MDVARCISEKMQSECGVDDAVASFHAHLPQEEMRCDLLGDRAAVWSCRKGKRSVKLSAAAGEILVLDGILNPQKLKL
jgi:hypothetical protein